MVTQLMLDQDLFCGYILMLGQACSVVTLLMLGQALFCGYTTDVRPGFVLWLHY